MKKEEIVAALDGIKNMTSVVSIHSMLEMLEKMEPEVRIEKVLGFTQEVADEVFNRIEKALDYNSDDLVDLQSAEFELSYNNQIELSSASINVYDTMKHIEACLDEFVFEAETEEEGEIDIVELERGEVEEDMTFSREEDDTLNDAPFPLSPPDQWGSPASINSGGTMYNEIS